MYKFALSDPSNPHTILSTTHHPRRPTPSDIHSHPPPSQIPESHDMHSTSNNAAPSAAAAYMGFHDVSGETYSSHGSGSTQVSTSCRSNHCLPTNASLQQIASREAAVSTGPYPGPVPTSLDASSPASSQGNGYLASVSLPPAAFNKQGCMQDGEDQSVAQVCG